MTIVNQGSSSMRGRGRGSLRESGDKGDRRNYSAPSKGGGSGRPGPRDGGEVSEKGPPRYIQELYKTFSLFLAQCFSCQFRH